MALKAGDAVPGNDKSHHAHHVLDFRYILFDVNRYQEEELYRAANLIASVFALDQRIDTGELINRLKKMAGGLKNLSKDEFKQLISWLFHILKAKFPEQLRERVGRMMEEANPWEVETVITNLEIALDEMQEQALLKGFREGELKGRLEGLREGELKGRLEVARNLLLLNVDVDTIVRATGLTADEVESLKKEIQ